MPTTSIFDSSLSRIYAGLDGSSIASFREKLELDNPFIFIHEACHWYQKQTLVGQALNLLLIEAFSDSSNNKKWKYEKALMTLDLLKPYSEGISLYAQFDYFPANYYSNFGKRNKFDALIEFIVAKRFSFQNDNPLSEEELGKQASDIFLKEKLSNKAIDKKKSLLQQPLFIGEPHITGYLLIKQAVKNIKTFKNYIYTHDGSIISGLTDFIYNYPTLAEIILDDNLKGDSFYIILQKKLNERICLLRDSSTIGEMFFHYSFKGGNSAQVEELGINLDHHQFQNNQINDRMLKLFNIGLLQSVSEYLLPNETIEEYNDRYYESKNLPFILNVAILFRSYEMVKFGAIDIRFVKKQNDWLIESKDFNFNILLSELGAPPMRVKNYLSPPHDGQEGRLSEIIYYMTEEYNHISIVDSIDGKPVSIIHKGDDYNLGYLDMNEFILNSYRIDKMKELLNAEIKLFEKEFKYRTNLSCVYQKIYNWATDDTIRHILGYSLPAEKKNLFRIVDLETFKDKNKLKNYLALTLLLPLFAHADDYHSDVINRVKMYAPMFGDEDINTKSISRFIKSTEPLCYKNKNRRYGSWWQFGTIT